jgi:hypothetical protein
MQHPNKFKTRFGLYKATVKAMEEFTGKDKIIWLIASKLHCHTQFPDLLPQLEYLCTNFRKLCEPSIPYLRDIISIADGMDCLDRSSPEFNAAQTNLAQTIDKLDLPRSCDPFNHTNYHSCRTLAYQIIDRYNNSTEPTTIAAAKWLQPINRSIEKLTPQAFKTIQDRLVPTSRIKSDSLLLADWAAVLQMAHWLGFDVKTESARLSQALKSNHCQEFQVCSIDTHRQMLTTIDRALNIDTSLSRFEADFAFLQAALKSTGLPHIPLFS